MNEVLNLDLAATELYADPRLGPLLRQLLAMSSGLVGAAASSVSLVDPTQHTYIKMAEHGASCQLGQSFPLDEGVTGQVYARRRPVLLDSYRDVPHGHLPSTHPARDGAVAAIPIWWRGDVIGANVLFSGGPHRFTTTEVDELEMLTQLAAPGIVRAAAGDPSLTNLIPQRPVSQRVPTDLRQQLVPSVADPSSTNTTALPLGSHTVAAASTTSLDPTPFTPREQDVLRLLAIGATDKELAQALVISTKTVEKHVGALLRKTGSTSRTAAVMRALDRGWLPPTVETLLV
ncbi:MAG: LuxR C-terminal-related transcriptional regulator [Nakamurella sp.]